MEANAINENANRRDVEELYSRMKSNDSSSLRKYFYQHFNKETTEIGPIELKEVPQFLKALQDVPKCNENKRS